MSLRSLDKSVEWTRWKTQLYIGKSGVNRGIHFFFYFVSNTIYVWSNYKENITDYKLKNDLPRAIVWLSYKQQQQKKWNHNSGRKTLKMNKLMSSHVFFPIKWSLADIANIRFIPRMNGFQMTYHVNSHSECFVTLWTLDPLLAFIPQGPFWSSLVRKNTPSILWK